VEMAVHEWFQIQQPNFYNDGIFKLVQRWDKFINVLGDCNEKQLYFSGIRELCNGFLYNFYDLGILTY
jgi:hypothetical protein